MLLHPRALDSSVRLLFFSLLVLLSACCSAPQTARVTETAFVAEVLEVRPDALVVRLDDPPRTVRVTGMQETPTRAGQRLYIQGALVSSSLVEASSVQVIP